MPRYSGRVGGEVSGGLRVDRYAAERLRLLNRSQIKARILEIRINGKAGKLSHLVKPGDDLDLLWADPPPSDLIPQNIALDILYEDDRVVVINKAPGLVVHPGAGNASGTLANGLLYRRLSRGGSGEGFRPGIVHRLDKDTSGVMIAAYDDEALVFLADQFKSRRVKKIYGAIVRGVFKENAGAIETPIARDRRDRRRFTVPKTGGKPALTRYRVIRSWLNYSLVLLRPKTGRTHQLRVHMAYAGHPILGDPLYGIPDALFPQAELMLHAKSLSLRLPGKEGYQTFTTPLPPRFYAVLRKLPASGFQAPGVGGRKEGPRPPSPSSRAKEGAGIPPCRPLQGPETLWGGCKEGLRPPSPSSWAKEGSGIPPCRPLQGPETPWGGRKGRPRPPLGVQMSEEGAGIPPCRPLQGPETPWGAYVLEETAAYAVVYKPPLWHSAPLQGEEYPGEPSARILLFWYAGFYPGVLDVRGKNAHEGGILHRLDYETHGLVLFAKTQGAMDALARQQREGVFTKEYGALSGGSRGELPGFPPALSAGPAPFTIESAFRPFGPGRREVRPVVPAGGGKVQKKIALDQGKPYTTEVLEMSPQGDRMYFRLRIHRGFRHQIRCHLSWLGYAVLNDKTYGGQLFEDAALALRAQGISFYDPESQSPRNYRIAGLV